LQIQQKIQTSWYGFGPAQCATFVSPKRGNNQPLFNQRKLMKKLTAIQTATINGGGVGLALQ